MKRVTDYGLTEFEKTIFDRWLDLPLRTGKGANRDRPRGDIAGHAASLQMFTLGFSKAEAPTTAADLWAALQAEDSDVIYHFLKGSHQRPRRMNRPPLAPRTVYKHQCFLLRFKTDLLRHEAAQQGITQPCTASELRRRQPAQARNPQQSLTGWPAGLQQEWEEYAQYRSDPMYAGPGVEYRKRVIRPRTVASDKLAFNQFVHYCMQVEHLTELTLLDLVDYQKILRFRRWYFAGRDLGGYTSFRTFCIQSAVLARYLCAAQRLPDEKGTSQPYPFPPDSKAKPALWNRLYALKDQTIAAGSNENKIVKGYKVPEMTPQDLYDLGKQAWHTEPLIKQSTKNFQPKARMRYLRRRAAMFFILAPFMPLRARNWIEMQWDRNLKRTPSGLWEIYFSGQDLKVSLRKGEQNVYRHQLTKVASEWVDTWRAELTRWIGEDFEAQTTYVFPQLNYKKSELTSGSWDKSDYNGFRTAINTTCLELRGHIFPPHQIRHIVATHLLNGATIDQAAVAAGLLGDKIETVLEAYYRPNLTKMYDQYFETVISSKESQGDDDSPSSEVSATTFVSSN